jgi:phospholipid transport system substrate-binding protein
VRIFAARAAAGPAHGRPLRRPGGRFFPGVVLCALLAVLPALADAGTSAPLDLVKETTSRIQAAIKENKADIDRDEARLYSLITDIVLPLFDFHRMSMLTLGPYWRSATPQQRERFVTEFRQLLVRTYGHTLIDYRNAKIHYLPVLASQDARHVDVRCEVQLTGENPVQLAYAMYKTKDSWKIYDVRVEGVSLVTNYRSSFAEIIQQKGMDGLIRRLAEKTPGPAHE